MALRRLAAVGRLGDRVRVLQADRTGFSAVNTTLDTSLFRLVVRLYCLRLHASSQTQTFGLLGRVRFYVFRQATLGSNCCGLKVSCPFQMANATRKSLRARITIDSVVEKPLALMWVYKGLSALL